MESCRGVSYEVHMSGEDIFCNTILLLGLLYDTSFQSKNDIISAMTPKPKTTFSGDVDVENDRLLHF